MTYYNVLCILCKTLTFYMYCRYIGVSFIGRYCKKIFDPQNLNGEVWKRVEERVGRDTKLVVPTDGRPKTNPDRSPSLDTL